VTLTYVERRRPPAERACEYLKLRGAVSETLAGVWVGIDQQVHAWAVDLISAALYVENFELTGVPLGIEPAGDAGRSARMPEAAIPPEDDHPASAEESLRGSSDPAVRDVRE
jgi:hypothetical protein